jgi:hypothetical protein
VRSFRNVLLVTSFVMTLIAVGVAVLGFVNPSAVPLCFQPERSGQTVVVCPTQQSALVDTGQASGPAVPDVDDVVKHTAGRGDLLVVELIGLTAAAVGPRHLRPDPRLRPGLRLRPAAVHPRSLPPRPPKSACAMVGVSDGRPGRAPPASVRWLWWETGSRGG